MTKMLHFRNYPHKGNPEGKSVYRNAYRPWYYKKKLEGIEAIGIERELNGLPIARIPGELLHANANAAQAAAADSFRDLVTDIRSDEQSGIVIPSTRDKDNNLLYDVELLSNQGRRAIDTEVVIHRYGVEMLSVILADFILLGHERIGTQSLNQGKSSMFALALNGFMQEIVSVFNKKAIPMLMGVNTFNTKKMPKLAHGAIEIEDITNLAMGMQHLANAGYHVTSPETQNEVWRRTNFPQQDNAVIEANQPLPGDEDVSGAFNATSNPKRATPVANNTTQ